MERYQVVIPEPAERAIRKLPKDVQARVLTAAYALAANPRPPGCLKMKGYHKRYRIRVGTYRVLYDIFDSELVIEIIDADHRRDAYR